MKFQYSGIGNFGVWSLFLGIINEITWSVPERTFSHYLVTADLPQGNDLTGVLRHNAKYGCRSCYAAKENLTVISFDFICNGRYHQITSSQFKEIQELNTQNARI